MFEFILTTLYTYIKDNIPEVKYINLFKATPDEISNGLLEGVVRPAIFIELEPITATSMVGKNTQYLEGTVIFRLVIDAYGGFDSSSETLRTNLDSMKTVDTIYRKLTGLSKLSVNNNEYILSEVRRTEITITEQLGNLMTSEIIFSFLIADNTLYQPVNEVQVNILDIEYNVD